MKKIVALLLALLMMLSLTACGAEKTAEAAPAEKVEAPAEPAPAEKAEEPAVPTTRVITDALGRQVEIPAQVESAVCVGSGALRYTSYMGEAALKRLVGVEDYEQERAVMRPYNLVNHELFAGLPVIGLNGEPSNEELIALYPQVIILSTLANVDADELQSKTSIPVVAIESSDSLLDGKAYTAIEILGEVFGLEERSEELTGYLKNMEAELQERSKGEAPRVYIGAVAFRGYHGIEWTEAGYAPLALLGAENLADSLDQSVAFEIDKEQILSWNPDVILLDYAGLELVREDYAADPSFYESLTAVQEGRVYAQIPFRSYAVNMEMALADAWYAGCVLYPDGFADVDPEAKTREILSTMLGADPVDELKEAGYVFTALSLEG
ncbi:MAG: ABC transporter substrate-binding protein [Oscillospiraceae bacterium]|nr:ABC transporter substrate-binding protein [Oscillospiraceae bacterium]